MASVSNIFGVLGLGLGIFGTLFYLVFYRKSHNRHHLVIAGFFVFSIVLHIIQFVESSLGTSGIPRLVASIFLMIGLVYTLDIIRFKKNLSHAVMLNAVREVKHLLLPEVSGILRSADYAQTCPELVEGMI